MCVYAWFLCINRFCHFNKLHHIYFQKTFWKTLKIELLKKHIENGNNRQRILSENQVFRSSVHFPANINFSWYCPPANCNFLKKWTLLLRLYWEILSILRKSVSKIHDGCYDIYKLIYAKDDYWGLLGKWAVLNSRLSTFFLEELLFSYGENTLTESNLQWCCQQSLRHLWNF